MCLIQPQAYIHLCFHARVCNGRTFFAFSALSSLKGSFETCSCYVELYSRIQIFLQEA